MRMIGIELYRSSLSSLYGKIMSLAGEYRIKDNDLCSVTFRVLLSTSYSNSCNMMHEIKVGTNLVLSSSLRYFVCLALGTPHFTEEFSETFCC